MNGLKTFFDSLSNTDKDMFLQLVGEFSMSVSQAVREGLEEKLEEVTKKIDKINSEREMLGSKAELFNKFAVELDKFSLKKDTSLEIVLLKQFFRREEDKLRRDIAELRPDTLLKEKYDIKDQLKSMSDKTSSFAKINHIMHMILKKNRRKEEETSSKKTDDLKKEEATNSKDTVKSGAK